MDSILRGAMLALTGLVAITGLTFFSNPGAATAQDEFAKLRDDDETVLVASTDDDDDDSNSRSNSRSGTERSNSNDRSRDMTSKDRSRSRDRSRDMTTADRSRSRDRSRDRTGDGYMTNDRGNSLDRSRDARVTTTRVTAHVRTTVPATAPTSSTELTSLTKLHPTPSPVTLRRGDGQGGHHSSGTSIRGSQI